MAHNRGIKMARTQRTRVPKYIWLKKNILELMKDAPSQGNDLPSERVLGEKYGVSRVTIRKAMGELEAEGCIYRVQGKGAFLCKEKIPQHLPRLDSFSNDMHSRNMVPDSHILALESIAADESIAQMLQVGKGDPVVLLKRLRLADGEPMAIETSYMRREIGLVIMEAIADGMSLYELFESTCSIKLKYARQSIEVTPLKGWERKLLQAETPAYALFMKRQTFDMNDIPVEYVESKYRSDRYRFHVELRIQ